eukprot:TRINITY_DN22444_c0_g1_i1.p1 TRINITY_DN22444_c0_g1~~TRINITY_DN22444_c0_g1_i1.p1  ORF type:complete len:1079 (+),score=196.95 TRINITY_DN22444_c0_g1_i1:71-3238(+)
MRRPSLLRPLLALPLPRCLANCPIAAEEYMQCFEAMSANWNRGGSQWSAYGPGTNTWAKTMQQHICPTGCLKIDAVGVNGDLTDRGTGYTYGWMSEANMFSVELFSEQMWMGPNTGDYGVCTIRIRPEAPSGGAAEWTYFNSMYVHSSNLYIDWYQPELICTGCIPSGTWRTIEILLDVPKKDFFRICVEGQFQGRPGGYAVVGSTGRDGIDRVELGAGRNDVNCFYKSVAWKTRVLQGCSTCTGLAGMSPCGGAAPPPASNPTASPSATPTAAPVGTPSAPPTGRPSNAPSAPPSRAPSGGPTQVPSLPPRAPSEPPSAAATRPPSLAPSPRPSTAPSRSPLPQLASPSAAPTAHPEIAAAAPTAVPADPPSSPAGVPSQAPRLALVTASPLGRSPAPSGSSPEPPTSAPSASPSGSPRYPEDPGLRSATAVAVAVTAISSVGGVGTAGGAAGRTAVVARAMHCRVDDVDLAAGEPIDREFHPTGIPLGAHDHRYLLGAVVINPLLPLLVGLVLLGLAAVQRRARGTGWTEALGRARAPGLCYVPVNFLMPGEALCAAHLAFFSDQAPLVAGIIGVVVICGSSAAPFLLWSFFSDQAPLVAGIIGVVVICGSSAAPFLLWSFFLKPARLKKLVYTVPDERLATEGQLSGWRRRLYIFVFGDRVWVNSHKAAPRHFVQRYGVVFEGYRECMQQYACFEMALSVAVSLLASWKPQHPGGQCNTRNFLIVFSLAAFTAGVCLQRPFKALGDNALMGVNAMTVTTAVILIEISLAMEYSQLDGPAHTLLMASCFLLTFKAGYDLLLYALEMRIGVRSDRDAQHPPAEAEMLEMDSDASLSAGGSPRQTDDEGSPRFPERRGLHSLRPPPLQSTDAELVAEDALRSLGASLLPFGAGETECTIESERSTATLRPSRQPSARHTLTSPALTQSVLGPMVSSFALPTGTPGATVTGLLAPTPTRQGLVLTPTLGPSSSELPSLRAAATARNLQSRRSVSPSVHTASNELLPQEENDSVAAMRSSRSTRGRRRLAAHPKAGALLSQGSQATLAATPPPASSL